MCAMVATTVESIVLHPQVFGIMWGDHESREIGEQLDILFDKEFLHLLGGVN